MSASVYCKETEFGAFELVTHPAPGSIPPVFFRSDLRQPEEHLSMSQRIYYFTSFREFYTDLITFYKCRKLSYDFDALNALQGNLRTVINHTGMNFLWGLPCLLFEHKLLWEMTALSEKRHHERFPSWSWLNYRYSKPDSDETQYPSYPTDLGITAGPSFLEVKEDDISPAMRECIKLKYDIIYQGCMIRMR